MKSLTTKELDVLYLLCAIARYNTERVQLPQEIIRRFLHDPADFDMQKTIENIKAEENKYRDSRVANVSELKIPKEFLFKDQKYLATMQFGIEQSLAYCRLRYGPFENAFKETYDYDLAMLSLVPVLVQSIGVERAKARGLRQMEYQFQSKEELADIYFLAMPPPEYIDYWKNLMTFSTAEFFSCIPSKIIAPNVKEKLLHVLHLFTFQLSDVASGDIDFITKPILRLEDDTYIIIKPQYLIRCLPQKHELLLKKIESYLNDKGHIFEKMALDIFEKLSRTQIQRSISYSPFELDGFVNLGNTSWFIECSSHPPSDSALNGNSISIKRDLEKAIIKCYNQAKRAIESREHPNLKRLNINENKGIIVILEGSYPNINSNALEGIDPDFPLWIVNFVDLEVLSFQPDVDQLEEFLTWRTQKDMPVICHDELDYWAWFVNMKNDIELQKGFKTAQSKKIVINYVSARFTNKNYLEKIANKR